MTLTDGAADTWIRRFHPAPDARVRLVCLPHAGGAASYWYPLSAAEAPEIEVLAVQYPGRQDRYREPCLTTIEALADQVTEALLPHRNRPIALLGHSMGAVIGFEVARRLEALGTLPVALFASGRRAPSRHRDEDVHLRGVDGIVAELRTMGGTDPQTLQDAEMLRMIVPTVRADYNAVENYSFQPGPPLSCPVHAMVGDSDNNVTLEDAEAWREHTTGGSELHVFSGGHFYLNQHQAEVVHLITDRLLSSTAPAV
uniref:Alpha/beta fold hydrolase n=1 Tax=Streptomyces sp. NBC_01401 TaxID=2903854 RepID=A0AAU3GVM0_9ACTN